MEAVLRSARVAYLSDLQIRVIFSIGKREEQHLVKLLTSHEGRDERCTQTHW
jgi:hypothetical protein